MALANNLGYKVVTQTIDWNAQVHRAWGSEWGAPDHGIYEFSNGRMFDSTDRGTTGIYNSYYRGGLMLNVGQYPDMVAHMLTESGYVIVQN
jgi:hypothetical protein